MKTTKGKSPRKVKNGRPRDQGNQPASIGIKQHQSASGVFFFWFRMIWNDSEIIKKLFRMETYKWRDQITCTTADVTMAVPRLWLFAEDWRLRIEDSFTPSGSSFLIPQPSVFKAFETKKILTNWKNPHQLLARWPQLVQAWLYLVVPGAWFGLSWSVSDHHGMVLNAATYKWIGLGLGWDC